MNYAFQDLKYAIRMLRKSPAVTAIAALSLALGIGANTAIFSLVDAVLLRSLPVNDPSRLVLLSDPNGQGVSMGNSNGVRQVFSYGEYEHLREGQRVFEDMYASQSESDRDHASIDGGPSEIIRERLVTGSYFSVLGIKPILGRAFTSADDRVPHAAPYAVISYEYWKSRFGSRGDVLGKRITVGRAPLTIIGVMPAGFFGETVGQAPDVWIPMLMQPDVMPGRDWLRDDETKVMRVMWLQVMGRLKPGVTLHQAQANMDLVFKQLLSSYQIADLQDGEQRTNFLNQSIKVRPGAAGANAVSEHFGTALVMLMAVVGFVLLIACANIANLVLARAAARHREIGIRVAMGAARYRLVGQMLTESLLLALLGGALGLIFATWSSQLLLQLVGGEQPLPIVVHTDWRVLEFTAALAILTGILFGLAPAIRAGRVDVSSTLKENARNVSGSGSRVNLGKVLVVSQIAISLLLLIGAGLFIRTFRNLLNVELGYNRDKLILFYIDAVSAGYKDQALVRLYNTLAGKIRSITGVKAVAYSGNGLFSGSEMGTSLEVEGYTPKNRRDRGARFDLIGPNYFSSLGIPILRGREIGLQDTAAAPPACVINETMAREMFAGRDPLGKQIRDLFPGSTGHCEIVGVARNVRDHSLRRDIPRRFYASVAHPIGGIPFGVVYEVRTLADPAQITAAIRSRVLQVNKAFNLPSPRSMTQMLDQELLEEHLIAQLSTFFGGTALLLASIGLYGVLSYNVTQRTSEIGIRLAIGAQQGTVMWLILRETLVLVLAGAVIGAAGAIGLARLVQSRMFGVATWDPVTIAGATAVLAMVATAAALLPALRAARVDPIIALRYE